MFHGRSLNNKINRLHERCLRIIYNDKHSNFDEELINKDISLYIHYNNIHALAIEFCKTAYNMSPKIMSEAVKLRDTPCYNLEHTSHFSTDPMHSVYNGTESPLYLGPKNWKQIPTEIKESLDEFK